MSKPNILFLGTHGQYNWGDELLLETFLHNFRDTASNFYVNSYDPEETKELFKTFNITTFHTTKDRLKLIYYILTSKIVMFGGGSIVKELDAEYGGETYSTLNTLNTLTKIVRLFPGKKIIFSNIGIGPIKTEKGQELAKMILNRGDEISLRDIKSMELAKKIGVSKPYIQVPDSVFSLDKNYFDLPETIHRNIKSIKDVKKIVLNLCRNIGNNDNWDYFLNQVINSLSMIVKENPTIEIVGLPMQYDTETNDDLIEIIKVEAALKKEFPEIKFSLVKPTSTKEIVNVLNEVDIVIAERLHLLILSTVIQKPFVALEYNIKVTGLLKDLELSDYGVDINKEFGEGVIADKIKNVAINYRSIIEKMEEKFQENNKTNLELYKQLKSKI